MDRRSLLEHVTALGLEFRRRGMANHTEKLRAYFLLAQAGLLDARNGVQLHWDEALTVEWMKVLQVPPFEDAYRIRSQADGCPQCSAADREVKTVMNFPGGFVAACRCSQRWLVLDR